MALIAETVVAEPQWLTLPPTPSLPAAARQGTAPVNGIRIWYAEFGQGEPVILLHGGLANSNYWGNQVRALQDRYQVIVMDSRGHGRSTRDDTPYGYDLMASDVIGLMDFLNIRKAAIVGWSDGAIIGLDIAMKHPERVTQAVRVRRQLRSQWRCRYCPQPGVQRVHSPAPKRSIGNCRRRRTATSLSCADRKNVGDRSRTGRRLSYTAIPVPTWIVDGDHDEAIKRENTEFMAAAYPERRPAAAARGQPFLVPSGSGTIQCRRAAFPGPCREVTIRPSHRLRPDSSGLCYAAQAGSRVREAQMTEIGHRFIETNGIRMHLAEKARARWFCCATDFPSPGIRGGIRSVRWRTPGFTSWRRICAGMARPRLRRRSTSIRCCIWSATWSALLDALGAETAVIAGHDWGAPVAWHAALLRPDRFRAVIGLSVPYRPRGKVRPTTVMPRTNDAMFYQLYFQQPGVAEADLEADVRASVRGILLRVAGEATVPPSGFAMVPLDGGMRARNPAEAPAPLPGWLTEADVDFYAAEFARTGFRGGLNWYRNIDRNWELLAPFAGRR